MTSLQTQKGHALTQWYYVAGQWARLYVLEMTVILLLNGGLTFMTVTTPCYAVALRFVELYLISD